MDFIRGVDVLKPIQIVKRQESSKIFLKTILNILVNQSYLNVFHG